MTEVLETIAFLALLGSALVGGIFFTFSNFVMKALGQLPEGRGAAAMQAINVTVLNPLFFLAFFGTGVLCAVIAFVALNVAGGLVQAMMLAGAALYVLGCLLVTIVFNVPLNNRLATVDSSGSDGIRLWTFYLSRWTLWNHVRTIACVLAAAAFAAALLAAAD